VHVEVGGLVVAGDLPGLALERNEPDLGAPDSLRRS
jgi:hypothetical protein